MHGLRTTHSSSLDARELQAIRRLLDDAFVEFTDDDWEHCLGGIHATIREADEIVAHGSVVQRRLLHAGRAWRTGYVEAVAVRADYRRRGYARAVMERLGEVIRDAYEIGGLAAGEPAATLYRSLGWRAWRGPTWALGPDGREPADDDSVYVLPLDAGLDLSGDLACDWRNGDVWRAPPPASPSAPPPAIQQPVARARISSNDRSASDEISCHD